MDSVLTFKLASHAGVFRGACISSLPTKSFQKAFAAFNADRVIIRLPCGQGQLSRIWKVQCDWLSMGKECCLQLSRRLWGGKKYELA